MERTEGCDGRDVLGGPTLPRKSGLVPGMRSRTGDVKVEVRNVSSTEIPEARDDTPGRMPGPDACFKAPRRPASGVERHLSFLLLISL
jgi:hypothetical protein